MERLALSVDQIEPDREWLLSAIDQPAAAPESSELDDVAPILKLPPAARSITTRYFVSLRSIADAGAVKVLRAPFVTEDGLASV